MQADRAVAQQIVAAGGESVSSLGLRFDRVAIRVLGDLRRFVTGRVPTGATVLLTLTAPIRMPAKTVSALEQEIDALLSDHTGQPGRRTSLCGNTVSLRLVRDGAGRAGPLVGFVHNRAGDAPRLLSLAERWLRGS